MNKQISNRYKQKKKNEQVTKTKNTGVNELNPTKKKKREWNRS